MADASLAAAKVTAPDALLALWAPSFPVPAAVEAAAAEFPPWAWLHERGPVHRLIIAPGVIRLESADLEKRYFTEQRARRRDDAEKAYEAEHGKLPDPVPTRRVLYWSDKSKSRMIRVFAELDYTPIVVPGRRPGLVTLTLPGDWLTVAPDAKAWKKLRDKFAKRWARAWGEPPTGIWKTEFQKRGAPHWHFFTSVPVGARAGELRMLGERYRPAVGDGLLFREWLSAVWADVVDHPDPEERAKHERAGTNFDDGLKFTDPKRVAVYFAKYSASADKAYQNMPPAEWRGPGDGVGRFWGYWGLEKATVAVRITPQERVTMARVLRRYARSRGVITQRRVPRGVTPDGEVKYRKVRRRSGARLASCSGYLTENDAPHLALALARLVSRQDELDCLPGKQVVSYLPPDQGSGVAMTELDDVRQRYLIKALLNAGVQPLADLGPEEFAALRKALGKHPLADPVSVSEDGLLLDGHQRLKAQLANGRVYIGAGEVHVIAGANRDNAMEWAVRLNVQRRHLTVTEKADLARSLQAQRHWGQAKIASLFGVSRPAVSQWLAKTASDAVDADPVMVEGKDGKLYPVNPVPRREPKMTRPWEPQGYGYRALSTALTRLQTEPYTGLTALKRAKLVEVLDGLVEASEKLLEVVTSDADRNPGDEG